MGAPVSRAMVSAAFCEVLRLDEQRSNPQRRHQIAGVGDVARDSGSSRPVSLAITPATCRPYASAKYANASWNVMMSAPANGASCGLQRSSSSVVRRSIQPRRVLLVCRRVLRVGPSASPSAMFCTCFIARLGSSQTCAL